MGHKANCAVYDPCPDVCDCGFNEAKTHTQYNQIIESLRAKNAELTKRLLWLSTVNEKMGHALFMMLDYPDRPESRDLAFEAKSLMPCPGLLKERDSKRDAALLRAASEAKDFADFGTINLYDLAAARESGEWIPELGE